MGWRLVGVAGPDPTWPRAPAHRRDFGTVPSRTRPASRRHGVRSVRLANLDGRGQDRASGLGHPVAQGVLAPAPLAPACSTRCAARALTSRTSRDRV